MSDAPPTPAEAPEPPPRDPAPAPDAAPAGPGPSADADGLTRRIVISTVLTVLVLVLACGGLFALIGMRPSAGRQPATAPLVAVRVQPVQRGDLPERLSGYGRARALRAADVSAEVAGVIAWVSPDCEDGSAVEAGAELLRLDPRDLDTALQAAEARKAQAEAAQKRAELERASASEQLGAARQELDLAETELERLQKTDPDAVSRSQIDAQRLQVSLRRRTLLEAQRRSDAAVPAVAQAVAEVKAASAAHARAELDRRRAVVRAPFAGRVRRRLVHEGQRVTPGTAVVRLIDPARVEVPVALPARHFGEVAPGAAATLRVPGRRDPVWSGPVARVAPEIDDTDRTFFVYCDVSVETGDAPVPAGAFLIGDIAGPTHRQVIAIPRTAFVGGACFVAVPKSVVIYLSHEAPGRSAEARAAQQATLEGLAGRIRSLLGTVAGCGAGEPPVTEGASQVRAPLEPGHEWQQVAAGVRAAIRDGGVAAAGVVITVGVEAEAAKRRPTVERKLPEVALVAGNLQPGELLIVTNLERVDDGTRVRLVGDVAEQVSK